MTQACGVWVVLGWNADGSRAQALGHADRWADADRERCQIIQSGYIGKVSVDVTEQWLCHSM